MIDAATFLKIIFFGGAADGGIVSIENEIEKVQVGPNLYVDSFYVDNEGRSIYYAAKGPGRMTKTYIGKLFKNDEIF